MRTGNRIRPVEGLPVETWGWNTATIAETFSYAEEVSGQRRAAA